ncbi:hypothetical protein PICST_28339 [Scheffersomyces stipitis CBS 6054]|uniref:F-box domain-containing protein n=1 Tax=Scheffersomyces stipitis (strain ATCC 58785 / CBS 6054 / NBRC 10063 / NRRL Y-11545) TaxID=322104 RepID=A3GFR7_PICST|nr:hypothetical protein PICST_28339 [Scheffersomyces stipitis CBS 6054]EAZ63800.2 hypothetical protein PICST_28339 [Scheffersomyces stipitis CBS 6054]
MGSIPLELLQFPEHIIQTIIDALPFKLVLCLASNGSSIFHKQLVNRVFRTVELGPFTSSNRALKVEWDSSILWERPYYTMLKEIEAKYMNFTSIKILDLFFEENSEIHVNNLIVRDTPNQEVLNQIHRLTKKMKRVSLKCETDSTNQQVDKELNLPEGLYGFSSKYFPDMRVSFPENLQRLELEVFDSVSILDKLPSRLTHLQLYSVEELPLIALRDFCLFPRTLKHLELGNCIDFGNETEVKIDLPLSLESFHVSSEVNPSVCLDISHLTNLRKMTVSFFGDSAPMSILKFPISIEELSLQSTSFPFETEVISGLERLKSFGQLVLYPSHWIPSCKLSLPDSVESISIDCGGHSFESVVEYPKYLRTIFLTRCGSINPLGILDNLIVLSIDNSEFAYYAHPMVQPIENNWRNLDMLESLKELSIIDSSMENIPKLPPFLRFLDLRCNALEKIDTQLPDTLVVIIVSKNKLVQFDGSGYKQLRKLDLSDNLISELSYITLKLPPGLRELSLKGNPITCVAPGFAISKSLQLDIRDEMQFEEAKILMQHGKNLYESMAYE